jgi:hypothetical protein
VSLSRLWAFLAIALPTLAAVIAPLQTVDLTYHLRAGAQILETRAIPSADTWTFTAAGLPWTDQQWGAQVLLAVVHGTAGWTGTVLLRVLLVALIVGCLFLIVRRRGLGDRSAAWLTLAAFIVAAPGLGLRPQLLGMGLFALTLVLVADRRKHPSRLWVIPLLVLVWANIHGSFFLGPAILGLAWLEDLHLRTPDRHRTLMVGIAAAVAACVTPFGPAIWAYAVGLSTNPEVTRRITEWQRTSPFDAAGLIFYASALGVLLLVARRGRIATWPTLIWLGLFFVVGAYAARGIAWWAIGALPAVAGLLVEGNGESRRRDERPTPPIMRRLNQLVATSIVIAGLALLPVWRPTDAGLDAPKGLLASAPPGITGALREMAQPSDHLLNPQVWGSWFEYALPDLPVAIDSRIEFFPPEVWDAFDLVIAGDDRQGSQLRQWGVTIVVARASDSRLVALLDGLGWRTTYSDVDGQILVAPGR